MRAVVLVGGFGTRLRPLTLHTPKQMLPVVHRPMIERVVEHLARHGIDEVVLAMNATLEGQTTAHYLAERLEKFPIRLTQLAHGLPVGGELDYLDEGTLAQALRARRPIS